MRRVQRAACPRWTRSSCRAVRRARRCCTSRARSARRAERRAWALLEADPDRTNPLAAKYLNRLSDLLFILSRAANPDGDVKWVPGGVPLSDHRSRPSAQSAWRELRGSAVGAGPRAGRTRARTGNRVTPTRRARSRPARAGASRPDRAPPAAHDDPAGRHGQPLRALRAAGAPRPPGRGGPAPGAAAAPKLNTRYQRSSSPENRPSPGAQPRPGDKGGQAHVHVDGAARAGDELTPDEDDEQAAAARARTPTPTTSTTLIAAGLVASPCGSAGERGHCGGVVALRRLGALGEHRHAVLGDGEESTGDVVGDLVAAGGASSVPGSAP